MKCNNCGFENVSGAEFCGNCGNSLIQNKEHQNINNEQLSTSQPQKKKSNKKLFIILGVLLGIVAIVIAIILIINKVNKFDDPFDDIDDLTVVDTTTSKKGFDESNSFTKKIEEDYKNGNLSKDEYIMQLAYSIYDTSKINYKYKSSKLDFNEPTELFKKFGSMINELSDDTVKYVFEKYTLSNVEWNVKEDPKVTGTVNNGIFDYEVKPLVNDNSDVSKLDNVKLSGNGNFLIYYTKEGSNAITDADANKIATFLETAVSGYKSMYNLDFHYDAQLSESSLGTVAEVISFGLFSQSTTKASQLLKNNNIDTKYLNTAMPVYIIDTDVEDTSVLGYYVAPIGGFAETILRVYDIFESNGTQIDNMLTTYSFPFFVVSSALEDFDDTKIILAHELFHHYQKYICGNGSYGECSSGNFTVETTADQAAIQVAGVNKTGTAINEHAGSYINDVESSIDRIGYKYNGDKGLGYGAFVFATNYADIVDNGANHMFNSLKTSKPLEYIYDNSNGKYKEVLLTTAKKNLTLDYSNKLLIGNSDGVLVYPPNHKEIGTDNFQESDAINYSSMHYYYINPSDYEEKTQISFNSSTDDLTLLLFVQENNSYKYLYTHSLNSEFVIDVNSFNNYEELVFVIVDSSISGKIMYKYELDNEGTKTPTVTAKSLKLETLEEKIDKFSSFVCHYVEEDNEYRTVTQIKLSFDKKDKINDMYFKGTIQMKNYNPDDPSFAIAQKIVSGLLYIMQHAYEEQFKYFKVITHEETDKYSVTFKITKNYYDALNNSLELDAETKYDIIKSIQAEGYICSYSK